MALRSLDGESALELGVAGLPEVLSESVQEALSRGSCNFSTQGRNDWVASSRSGVRTPMR